MKKKPLHFEGKDALDHLVEARRKGASFEQEIHGSELTGYLASFVQSTKEATVLFLLFLPLSSYISLEKLPFFFATFLGFSLWRSIYSALQGFSKLERLHRIVEEEKWEIEHHRDQEKEELYELYEAKGFSGKMLDQIITTLMSDDHRLLEVMLKEEIGLKIGSYEHPLKASIGAFIGAFFSFSISILGWFLGSYLSVIFPLISLACITAFEAKKEKEPLLQKSLWHISSGAFLYSFSFFLMEFFHRIF